MNSRIQQITPLTADSMKLLILLYYPLMNRDAVILYQLMAGLDDTTVEEDLLLSLTGFHRMAFLKARKYLEQFHLLRTYQSETVLLYHVFAPLDELSFFAHDTFSRMLLQMVGSTRFDQLKTLLIKDVEMASDFKEISEPTDVSSLDQWDETRETTYSSLLPDTKLYENRYHFDFQTFLQGMDRIFPIQMRTKTTLERIAKLADIHGIEAKDMRKYVMRSIHPVTHHFNWDQLKSLVYKNQTKVPEIKDLYDLAPVQFLKQKQKGVPVSPSDHDIIETVCKNYGFSNSVMNCLIEYTLQNTDQKFPRTYVEKVASSWARKGIDSKEKALREIHKPKKTTTSPKTMQYPSWYEKQGQKEASQELSQEVQNLLSQLGGDDEQR